MILLFVCFTGCCANIYFYSLFSTSRSSQLAESQNIIPIPTQHTLPSMLGRVFIKTKHYFTRVISKYFFDCKAKTKVIRVNNKKYSSTPMVISLVIYRELYIMLSWIVQFLIRHCISTLPIPIQNDSYDNKKIKKRGHKGLGETRTKGFSFIHNGRVESQVSIVFMPTIDYNYYMMTARTQYFRIIVRLNTTDAQL